MSYIKDDKKYYVQTVENNEDPEEPPGRRCREQKGETTPGVIEQEFELFPNTASPRCYQ